MISNFPALTGDVVTERHAAICRERGHATHIVDGVDSGMCPRCGEVVAMMNAARETLVRHPYAAVVNAWGYGGGATVADAEAAYKAHGLHKLSDVSRTLVFFHVANDAEITSACFETMMALRDEAANY